MTRIQGALNTSGLAASVESSSSRLERQQHASRLAPGHAEPGRK